LRFTQGEKDQQQHHACTIHIPYSYNNTKAETKSHGLYSDEGST